MTAGNHASGIILNASFGDIARSYTGQKAVILTDNNIYSLYAKTFAGYEVILIEAGENIKTQETVNYVIQRMLDLDMDKSSMLIGVGGGVVTDIAGYAASVYKRGIPLGLVPTSILGMTDAAIGGKNGVNVGIYKNMVGTTYRPSFILYDMHFLNSLPKEEWVNGFAEIIKHACIKDARMFADLEMHSIEYYRENNAAIAALIEQNIGIKSRVVENDEFETGERYLLNFGHSFGHAIENIYSLPHGHAISIGMLIAARISELLEEAPVGTSVRIESLLKQYGLTVALKMDTEKLNSALIKDKKRKGDSINFVLLNEVGMGIVRSLPLEKISALLPQTIS